MELLSFSPEVENASARLIDTIKPSKESVERRHGVQAYVRSIISRTFAPEQVGGARSGCHRCWVGSTMCLFASVHEAVNCIGADHSFCMEAALSAQC